MASSEVYDFIGATTPDYDAFLNVTPQRVLTEQGGFSQVSYLGEDGSEVVVDFLPGERVFYFIFNWEALSESEAGTIFDFYFDTAKAFGKLRSFKLTHPTDGHTYIVRFDTQLQRDRMVVNVHRFSPLRLKILGLLAITMDTPAPMTMGSANIMGQSL